VALSDKLNRRRGFEVFKDVDNIRPGQDWLETVEESIEQCDVLLVLIGNDWRDARGDEGHSLDENDHVRREIEAGLARKKAVIPILFENADLPHSNELPESIRPLLRRQSLRIRNSTFNRDLDVLVSQLRVIARSKAPAAAVKPPEEVAPRPAPIRPIPPPPPPAARAKPDAKPEPTPERTPDPAYVQPPPFTQAAPTFAPAQPPTQYQQSWPGPGGWGAQWGGQAQPNQTILRIAQACVIGLFISGALLGFLALVAIVIPNVAVTDETTPTDFIVLVGLVFGAIAVAQILSGYGVFRRFKWAGWVGGGTCAVIGALFLLGGSPITYFFSIGELLIVGGLAAAGRAGWFQPGRAR
jgi:hypothetical protein